MTEEKYSSSEYSRKTSYEIREVSRSEATDLVQANHYSPVMPKHTKHWLGVFKEDTLVGVITLGWGTQPKHTIQKIINKDMTAQNYFEIGKMCMLDSEIKNSETQMISQVIEWIKRHNEERNSDVIQINKEIRKKNWIAKSSNPNHVPTPELPLNPEIKFLYTLADGIMGKCGYVYQAANFYYGGEYWTDSYMSLKGEKVHPRTTRRLCFDNWAWHYDKSSVGFSQEFKDEFDRKAEEKRHSYNASLQHALGNLPVDLDPTLRVLAYQFATDFTRATLSYQEDYEDFLSSGKPLADRPREEEYLPAIPRGLSSYLPNPKKDYIKKQQVFWLSPDFMRRVGMKKISGKMFRYIYPMGREAKKLLKNSETDWKLGSGVYPKEEDLKWKEQTVKGKKLPLDSMPKWNLQVVEYNQRNVNAHKKNSVR